MLLVMGVMTSPSPSSWVGMRRIARVAIPVIKVKREGHMITKETGEVKPIKSSMYDVLFCVASSLCF